jgi:AcrR family transcriptional regulator
VATHLEIKRTQRKPAEDRRQEILQVAARLFRAKGYAATSLEEVADAIGITKAAIYYHFPSKDEVLFEMHDRIVRESCVRVQAIVESDQGPVEKMERILTGHLETLLANLDANVVFQREVGFLPDQRESEIRKREREHDLLIRRVYRDGVERGEFPDIDAAIAVNILLGACNMTYRWYKPSGSVSPSGAVKAIFSLLQHGYLRDEQAAPPDAALRVAAGRGPG